MRLIEQEFQEIRMKACMSTPNRVHWEGHKLIFLKRLKCSLDSLLQRPAVMTKGSKNEALICSQNGNVHILVGASAAVQKQIDGPAATESPDDWKGSEQRGNILKSGIKRHLTVFLLPAWIEYSLALVV